MSARCFFVVSPVAIIEEEEDVFDKQIDEEYLTWKKNAPYLYPRVEAVPIRYDLILSHALEWPSLSVQWLPGCTMFASLRNILIFGAEAVLVNTHVGGRAKLSDASYGADAAPGYSHRYEEV